MRVVTPASFAKHGNAVSPKHRQKTEEVAQRSSMHTAEENIRISAVAFLSFPFSNCRLFESLIALMYVIIRRSLSGLCERIETSERFLKLGHAPPDERRRR